MVKTETGPEKTRLRRERANYGLAAVASCRHIRSLYDVIGPDGEAAQVDETLTNQDPLCLVLEWMEQDLRTLSCDQFRKNSNVPKIVARSVLAALVVLKTQYNAVHTGGHLVSLV